MNRTTSYIITAILIATASCNNADTVSNTPATAKSNQSEERIKPVYVTDTVQFDTDDPAIWLNPADASQSLVLGTDKDSDGGLYVFNLEGKMINKVKGLKRPNNVDIAYGFLFNGQATDIAVVTERETNKIRVYRLPDMQAIDKGGLEVFAGSNERAPMGIALYTAADHTIYAIVGRKTGPSGTYLWQYKLADKNGAVEATLVRKFGQYSGKKEIEAIAVDNESGYVYYSDEQTGIRKYYADPAKGNEELALFGTTGFTDDHEGISIYKSGPQEGYILVSNQQKNTFMVYPRQGAAGNKNQHDLLAEIPVSTLESDGSEVSNSNLGPKFPKGLFVAMSNGKVFHYYDWSDFQKIIDRAAAAR